MMGLSVQHLVLLLVVGLLLFGRGKISELMGDVGKGLKSFRKGLAENDASVQRAPAAGFAREAANADVGKPY